MDSQTWYTVLGGLLSGLVGVGLFFLQRSKAKRDEQQNLIFRIYQIIAMPGRPEFTRDMLARVVSQLTISEIEQKEIRSFALLLKDKDLANRIFRFNISSKEEKHGLLKELERRLNPGLIRLIEEETAKAVTVTSEKTTL